MSLRSQLAISHLKVLLAFVVIHLVLFLAATRLGGNGQREDQLRFEQLRMESSHAKNRNELESLLQSYARQYRLTIELEDRDGKGRVFGETRRRPPPQSQEFLWEVEGSEPMALRLRGGGGPPANPVIHVLLTTLLASVFGVVLAFRFSKVVSTPLADLVTATEQLEAGAEKVDHLMELQGPQEIVDLGNSFARMSETLSAHLRKLEQERDRAEASEVSRRQLIADVSHNLRTPLAAAIGNLDSLLDGHVEDQQSCLTQIRRETLWASQRLERLLHLSRWEHAEPLVSPQPLSLSDIVLEVAENLEERAREVSLTLELDIEAGIKVEADRHHLRDLVQILLENIIEHSGVERYARLQAHRVEDKVEFTIDDNGVGFDQEFLESWRGEPSVAKTGRVSLGLAIARRLAKAHGSELKIVNKKGEPGSITSFHIPASFS